MVRKSFITLGLLFALCASATCAMAETTIYTDDLGRMHFLGKDPGGKTSQQMTEFNNPAMMKFNNGEITKGISSGVIDTAPNAGYERRYKYRETNVSNVNKSKGSFTYDKGAMDASNPYTYGETNFVTKKTETTDSSENQVKTEKKHFWDNW